MNRIFLRAGGAVTLLVAIACCDVLSAQETDEAATETLKAGDVAPDFEAETFEDKTIRLSERFGDNGHPVILLFSRANW